MPFRSLLSAGFLVCMALILAGCVSHQQTPEQRYSAAKALFDQTTKNYHLPSAEAKASEKAVLLNQAATGYEKLLREYHDQPFWCAQALRSLGNVRATQGRLDEAVKIYARVAKQYPKADWEILQAWKAAGDLLWEANRPDQAKTFYRQIVDRFDGADSPAIVKATVRGARNRLGN